MAGGVGAEVNRADIRFNLWWETLEKIFDTIEVAKILLCSRKSVYRLILSGQLRGFKLTSKPGSGWRCTESQLRDYINRQQTAFDIENGFSGDE